MYSTYRAPSAQKRTLVVFFGKSIEAIVILSRCVDQRRVRFPDAGLTQSLPHARRILLYVAREVDQCTACFRAHI